MTTFFKKGQPGLFLFIFVFSNKHYKYECVKMSIQYPAPGFELTTFCVRVSSLNHLTRAPALK